MKTLLEDGLVITMNRDRSVFRVDILVENWAGGQYITYNYREHIMRIRRRPETAVVKN